jgi:RloB-like protein
MAIDRRKRPLKRDEGEWRDASLFIIATEGEKTEPRYFGLFKSPKIKVLTLECRDGRSSPDAVMERISEFKGKYYFGRGDTFWLVVDRDRWTIKTLSAVFAECRRRDLVMTVSNPQFEVWLAFHFQNDLPTPPTKANLTRHLRALLGSYSKTRFPTDGLVERSPQACQRARQADTSPNAIWPDAPGSRVYLLTEELLRKIRS